MIIEIDEIVKKEIQIEFPHYTTDGLHFYKFKDEHNCTQVVGSKIIGGFKVETSVNFPKVWMLFDKITEKEFNDKFNETIKILIDGNK